MAGDLHCDLLVVGSGAGGLGTAVVAAELGLRVLVVEAEPQFGGTTAWSGGWMWVPRNPLAVAADITEDVSEPRRYLQHLLGPQFNAAHVDAFLAHAPAMVQWHLARGTMGFVDGNAIPDFHGRAPSARTGGRSVCAAPFDAARLGPMLPLLKPPHPLMSLWGMSIGGDLRLFQRANRQPHAAAYVARRLLRHAWDVLTHGQGRLRMGGNALVAALLAAAQQRGVQLRAGCAATALHTQCEGAARRVTGATLATPEGPCTVQARVGVVLACGGFPHDSARQAAWFHHANHQSAAPRSNRGAGLRLAESVGAALHHGPPQMADAGAWAPVSLVPHAGGTLPFPHLVERGKPGLIAVDANGRRFVDEAGDYHSFMRALFQRCQGKTTVQAWLLCDAHFLRRWGLGAVRPWPLPHHARLRDGYLKRGRSWRELASACGIDAAGLEATVAAHNRDAQQGEDRAFGRGSTPYDRMQGDADHPGPNPCLAPLLQPPFYAVRVVPGSLGTFAGVSTDAHARALDAAGQPIAGLYAAGNDMASVMGGHYPSGGITLGPALTFGWIAAHQAAGVPLEMPT